MTTWATTGPFEGLIVYSPVGLRLLDELTSEEPIGNVEATLQAKPGYVGDRGRP